MKSAFIFSLALVLLMVVSAVPVSAEENEYGVVDAWFNGKNATVEGVKMKIGEPAEIKVTVTSKINGHVFLELHEVGGTKDFDILSGLSNQDERIDNLNIEPDGQKHIYGQ